MSERNGESQPERTLSVVLNGSPDKVVGIDWPAGKTRIVEEPHTLTITFPSGKAFRSYSKMTILDQTDGRVTAIKVLPMKDADSFATALSTVKRVVGQLGVAEKPLVRNELKKWETAEPAFSDSTGAIVEHRVNVFIRMEPHRMRNGWFVSVELDYLNSSTRNRQ
jgi:hypothetical protein